MKRKLIVALCLAILMVGCLASCRTDDCQHTFSDKWYSDAENHWHPATCDHAETERSELAPHVDEEQDGVCDVCEYVIGHTHTFDEAWQSDSTHHWKNATCSHTEEKGSYSAHSDEDMDGKCDACSGHVHSVNAAGYCKYIDCGEKVREIDETSLDELVAAVLVQKHLVNGGTVDYNFEGRSNTGSSYGVLRNEIINYLYGKDNYTHVDVASKITNGGEERTGTFESWHQLAGPEYVFGIVSENGGALSLDLPEVAKLNGYYIALSTLAGEYGVEETLYALYEVAIAETTNELEVIPDTAENKVTFKYNYKTLFANEHNIAIGDNAGKSIFNVNFFEVEVTFKYSDDYALTDLMILVDCYTNDPGTAAGFGFLYPDVDIEYDPDTDTFTFIEYTQDADGNWVANPTDKRTPDTYVINVTQTLGDRTEENPHPQSEFVPESFDLFAKQEFQFDENGNETGYELKDKVVGNIFVDAGEVVNLYVGNYAPANTSLHFIADQVTFKLYKDGVEVENANDYLNQTAVAEFTYGGTLRSFFVIPKVDGAYKFEIYVCGNLEKTVNIIAGAVDEEKIELKDNEIALKITERYEWANEYTFTATESGTYYFNVPAGVGLIDADAYDAAAETPATDDGPIPFLDYNNLKNPDGTYMDGSFSLELEAGETVRFYVNAVKKGTYIVQWAVI